MPGTVVDLEYEPENIYVVGVGDSAETVDNVAEHTVEAQAMAKHAEKLVGTVDTADRAAEGVEDAEGAVASVSPCLGSEVLHEADILHVTAYAAMLA